MAKRMSGGVSELSKASRHRLDDARALLTVVRWRGAMYLAGYAVECLLKTKLMRRYGCLNLEELEQELRQRRQLRRQTSIFTHELVVLLNLLQGRDRLRQNVTLWQQFNLVNRWAPAWRYSADLATKEDALDFVEAVEKIYHWINANT